MFNTIFNNISLISWRSVLLVEEIRRPGENYRPAASYWQTLSYNVVSSTPCHQLILNDEVCIIFISILIWLKSLTFFLYIFIKVFLPLNHYETFFFLSNNCLYLLKNPKKIHVGMVQNERNLNLTFNLSSYIFTSCFHPVCLYINCL